MRKKIILGVLSISLLAGGSYTVYESLTTKATCSPYGNCKACKNCRYCKNCTKNGGSCSVCR